jgi:hypothetical protein
MLDLAVTEGLRQFGLTDVTAEEGPQPDGASP